MKTNIEKLEYMLQLAENNFKKLQYNPKQGESYVVAIEVANYSDTLFIAADMLKLCILAVEAEKENLLSLNPMNSQINLTGILEIVLQLLPFEEMEILDELQVIIRNKDK